MGIGAPGVPPALRGAGAAQSVIAGDGGAGITDAEPNGTRPGGRSAVGSYRADLRILGTRRLAEYDGAVHREQQRHVQDLDRERNLHWLGWQRYGYTAGVVLHQGLSVLRDADDALGRPHEPLRIRPWHAALTESLFSAAGTAGLRSRWAVRATGDRPTIADRRSPDLPRP